MKVALVHDFLTQQGGAEKVLETITEIYPESPIHVLFFDQEKVDFNFSQKKIHTSFLQKIPFALKKYQWCISLMPAAIEHFDLSDFDIVISSSSAFAKGILTKPNTLHICYCHTPTRYLWTDTHDYIKSLNVPQFIKVFIPLILNRLRVWDRLAADRVDFFIANSATVQRRIQKYYNCNSDVIFPPVNTNDFGISQTLENYYITGGRLVPYKRIDLAIHACNQLNKTLKIFGKGPELNKLKKIAGPTIEFIGYCTNDQLKDLYSKAQAFIHPQEEDFGITPVESMASGRPVIGYAKGGLLESVIHNETGILFKEQTVDSLIRAIKQFEQQKFSPEKIKNHAEKFSKEKFKSTLKEYINQKWNEFSQVNK